MESAPRETGGRKVGGTWDAKIEEPSRTSRRFEDFFDFLRIKGRPELAEKLEGAYMEQRSTAYKKAQSELADIQQRGRSYHYTNDYESQFMYGRSDIQKLKLPNSATALFDNKAGDGWKDDIPLSSLIKQFRGSKKVEIESWEKDYDKTAGYRGNVRFIEAAQGLIPNLSNLKNFPDYLQESVAQAAAAEHAAGVPWSNIRVGKDQRIPSPDGVAVYDSRQGSVSNAIAEHGGVRAAMEDSMAFRSQKSGFAQGYIPNFATTEMLMNPQSGDMMVGESVEKISNEYGINQDSELEEYIKVKNTPAGTEGGRDHNGEILVDSLGNKIGKSAMSELRVIANEERKRLVLNKGKKGEKILFDPIEEFSQNLISNIVKEKEQKDYTLGARTNFVKTFNEDRIYNKTNKINARTLSPDFVAEGFIPPNE